MKEVYGEFWDYPADYRLITTNGAVRKDGAAVMGRGVALQAKQRYPGIEFQLGSRLRQEGNSVHALGVEHLFSFPVKYYWNQKADLLLIAESARQLAAIAEVFSAKIFLLPRPGCGNGGLEWNTVKDVIQSILPDNVHVITW